MATTKQRNIRSIEVFPDKSMKVYYSITFTDTDGEVNVANTTQVFAKTDTKPAAVKNFLKNATA